MDEPTTDGTEQAPEQSDQPEQAEPPEQAAAGKMVCIKPLPDGTYSVCVEDMPAEDAKEESGEGLGQEPATPQQGEYEETHVENVEQALKAAFLYLKQMPNGNSDEAQFEAGYQSNRPSPSRTQGGY